MHFSQAVRSEIDKLYHKRSHVELSIGILREGENGDRPLGPRQNTGRPDGADLSRRLHLQAVYGLTAGQVRI